MGLSLPHLIILALVVLVLFGRGRISEMMGDFGKGIKSFKQGMDDETVNRQPTQPPAQIPAPPVAQTPPPPVEQQSATLNGETVVEPTQAGPR
jgi:sec-independent protein translocase protein TatA